MNTTLTVVNVQVLNGELGFHSLLLCKPPGACTGLRSFVTICKLPIVVTALHPSYNLIHFSALLPGEMPAAVQHNSGGRPELGQSPMPIILVLLFYRFLLSAHIC